MSASITVFVSLNEFIIALHRLRSSLVSGDLSRSVGTNVGPGVGRVGACVGAADGARVTRLGARVGRGGGMGVGGTVGVVELYCSSFVGRNVGEAVSVWYRARNPIFSSKASDVNLMSMVLELVIIGAGGTFPESLPSCGELVLFPSYTHRKSQLDSKSIASM